MNFYYITPLTNGEPTSIVGYKDKEYSIVNGDVYKRQTVDNFFSSLYSGDWTVFENGILNAIGLAKRYTEALSNRCV